MQIAGRKRRVHSVQTVERRSAGLLRGRVPSSAPPPPGYVPPMGAPSAAGLSENVASALCYVFGLVSGIIFLVLAPYNQNKTIRFHAFQSIFMHVGIIILFIALSIVSVMMHGLGIFGLGLLSPLHLVGFIPPLALYDVVGL